MDDVASPPQLREAMSDIEELKIFKTKAVTMFMVVQSKWVLLLLGRWIFNLSLLRLKLKSIIYLLARQQKMFLYCGVGLTFMFDFSGPS